MTLLHTRFLFLTSTRAAIFGACFVELPGDVEDKGAAGGILHGQFTIAVERGIRRISVEEIASTQVEGQRTHPMQVQVTL